MILMESLWESQRLVESIPCTVLKQNKLGKRSMILDNGKNVVVFKQFARLYNVQSRCKSRDGSRMIAVQIVDNGSESSRVFKVSTVNGRR